MNNARREKLRGAVAKLSDVHSIVYAVCDTEQDSMDNMPENLQGTERFERMEDAVDHLNEALEKLDEAKDHIQAAIG